MSWVPAAVVVLGVVCLLNLMLTLGVVRRLREQAGTTGGSSAHDETVEVMTPPNNLVGAFAATATTGEQLSRADLTGLTLVGFFSPGCSTCKEKIPEFVRHAERMPGGRGQVIASVMSLDGDGPVMVAALESVARVVVEKQEDPMFAAFEVRGFPAYGLIGDDGRILAQARDVREIPLPVAI